MKAKCTKKTDVYSIDGKLEYNRYIAKNDVVEFGEILPNVLIKVTYPSGKISRVAYLKSLENFKPLWLSIKIS